jgi:formiminotetrahydrofolate cyclodeaminase
MPTAADRIAGDMSVSELLDDIRGAPSAPAGGTVAGLAVAMSAALLEMAARHDPSSDELDGAVAQAASCRRVALRLAEEDAAAFAAADASLRNPPGDDQVDRDAALGNALDRASAVPLRISHVAADVVDLGVVVAGLSTDDRRPDVATAVLLAEAACAAAAHLVEVNLGMTTADDRLSQAREAGRRVERALADGSHALPRR